MAQERLHFLYASYTPESASLIATPAVLACRAQGPDIDRNVLCKEQFVQFRIHQIEDFEVILGGHMGINNRAALRGMRADFKARPLEI